MGATRAVASGEDSIRAAMGELGMTEGFDAAFEMSGSPHALTTFSQSPTTGRKLPCSVFTRGLRKSISTRQFSKA